VAWQRRFPLERLTLSMHNQRLEQRSSPHTRPELDREIPLAASRRSAARFLSAVLAALTLIAATPRSGHALIGPTTPTFAFGWGTAGTSPGQFNSPWGCTTDALGNVFVVDRANGRIQKFDFLGNWSMTIGGLTDPLFVAVSFAGEVYVSDHSVVK